MPSVHRAFIYAFGAPGYGEYYVGEHGRGLASIAVFLVSFAGFTVALWRTTGALTAVVGTLLMGDVTVTATGVPPVPYFALGISVLGMYFSWLWGLVSAVDVAVARRRALGAPPQVSLPWGVAMAWLCPGSGQIYAGQRRFGFWIFGAYLVAILGQIPAYVELVRGVLGLAGGGAGRSMGTADVARLGEELSSLNVAAQFNLGILLVVFVGLWAIAETVVNLRASGASLKELPAEQVRAVLGLGVLGWLCPGAGHLVTGNDDVGWLLLQGYLGAKAAIGLGLLVGLPTAWASTLDWVPWLMQWSAAVHAPAALWLRGRNPSV